MRRNEVWWASFALTVGRRPVVLISRDLAYRVRANVTVVEVTTHSRGVDTEVPLGPKDGLPRKCVASADNVHTIPKASLTARLTTLVPAKAEALDTALKLALQLR